MANRAGVISALVMEIATLRRQSDECVARGEIFKGLALGLALACKSAALAAYIKASNIEAEREAIEAATEARQRETSRPAPRLHIVNDNTDGDTDT